MPWKCFIFAHERNKICLPQNPTTAIKEACGKKPRSPNRSLCNTHSCIAQTSSVANSCQPSSDAAIWKPFWSLAPTSKRDVWQISPENYLHYIRLILHNPVFQPTVKLELSLCKCTQSLSEICFYVGVFHPLLHPCVYIYPQQQMLPSSPKGKVLAAWGICNRNQILVQARWYLAQMRLDYIINLDSYT